MNERGIRRMAGFILARLPEAGLHEVADPRRGPIKWKLSQLLTAVTVGAMAGCGSLREVEQLTQLLSPATRRRLGLARRQPDTTLRDALCALSVDELRACLKAGPARLRGGRGRWRARGDVGEGCPGHWDGNLPTVRIRRIEAEKLSEADDRDAAIWSGMPKPLMAPLDLRKLHVPQGPRSGINAIWGQWPGDETEEEFMAAVEEMS